LRPGPTANDLIAGVLGREQARYGIRIYAVAVMSNHLRVLFGLEHAVQLAAFMQHALANIAKEAGRHHRGAAPSWSRRYRSIRVADAENQVARLRYVLCQELKERLVDRAERWPGVSSVKATKGTRLLGVWYDRTAQFEARRRGAKPDPFRTEKICKIQLSHIRALADRTAPEYRGYVADLIRKEEDGRRSERPGSWASPPSWVRGVSSSKIATKRRRTATVAPRPRSITLGTRCLPSSIPSLRRCLSRGRELPPRHGGRISDRRIPLRAVCATYELRGARTRSGRVLRTSGRNRALWALTHYPSPKPRTTRSMSAQCLRATVDVADGADIVRGASGEITLYAKSLAPQPAVYAGGV
jgi:hypothetical protein